MEKFPYQDSVNLGQQRPQVSGRIWVGVFWGLIMEVSAAAILYVLYKTAQFLMR